jgi:hypothetical protein
MRRFLGALACLAAGIAIGFWLRRPPPPPAAVIPPPAPPLAAPPPPAPAPGLDCQMAATFHGNLYPSLILSLGANHPEYARCLTLEIDHAAPNHPCEVRIESNLFQSPFFLSANPDSDRWLLHPDLPWNYEALRRSTQTLPVLFVLSVTAGGRTVQSTLTCMVHPVNEVVSRIFDRASGAWQDTSVCFAAFVNEDHPWINQLLQEALTQGGAARFTGYEFGQVSVAEQMQTIWTALAARRLSYVDLGTVSTTDVSDVATQYVRFLDQSVRDQGANCVDASVLIAAVFRRIGLRPVLVFRPGHCFVAVYDSAAGGQLLALETTMLGSSSFSSALVYGAQELQNTTSNLGTAGFSLVDIATARAEGVRPIGYAEGGG